MCPAVTICDSFRIPDTEAASWWSAEAYLTISELILLEIKRLGILSLEAIQTLQELFHHQRLVLDYRRDSAKCLDAK